MPVIDYEHEYPQEIRDAYTALRPSFDETFSPRLAMGLNVGAQLHYQKTAFPEEFAEVATILTYAQYWTARLTGVAANELTSLGCHTDLWNPRAASYSSLVDRLGIRDLMPRTKLQMLAASLSPQHGERKSRSAAARLLSRERGILSWKKRGPPVQRR